MKIRRRRDDNDTTDERDDGDNFDEHIQTQNERGAIANIFDSLFDAFTIDVDRIADKIDKSMLRLEDMAAELIEVETSVETSRYTSQYTSQPDSCDEEAWSANFYIVALHPQRAAAATTNHSFHEKKQQYYHV